MKLIQDSLLTFPTSPLNSNVPKKPRLCFCGCGEAIVSPYRNNQRYVSVAHRTRHWNNSRSRDARARKKRVIQHAFKVLSEDQKKDEGKKKSDQQIFVLKKSRGGAVV